MPENRETDEVIQVGKDDATTVDDVAIYDSETKAAAAPRREYGREDGRSLGELFSELSRETTTLVRQEVKLAKMELSEMAAKVGKNVAYLAAGGAIAYAGFLFLLVSATIGLGWLLENWWLSALIVGLIVLAIGGWMAWEGWNNLKKMNYAPDETIESLKEDKEWLKKEM